jgi:hypothetical protein
MLDAYYGLGAIMQSPHLESSSKFPFCIMVHPISYLMMFRLEDPLLENLKLFHVCYCILTALPQETSFNDIPDQAI